MSDFIFKILEKLIEELVKDPAATEKNLRAIRDQILATPSGRAFTIVATVLVLIACLIGLLKLLGWIADAIKKFWNAVVGPFLRTPEETKRARDYRLFAEYIVNEMLRLNQLEDWRDYRYAELEAEVEADGDRTLRWSLIRLRTSGLRRERSLSHALEHSPERLILVEGEPGSGKSVALRHLTETMARRASHSKGGKEAVPLYLNLKKLDRNPSGPMDPNSIEAFVLKTLKAANSRNIDAFLEAEFQKGLREGRWFFLFDSFDEAPEILTSTEEDDAIRQYADAIEGFLGGLNVCRGIIASRHFRGPRQLRWPKFRILPLSEQRQIELIRKANLQPALEKTIVGQLSGESTTFEPVARNPMLLGILVDHVHRRGEFPANIHTILSTYIDDRLEDDAGKLKSRFSLTTEQVRRTSELIAFTMMADPQIGLSTTRKQLSDAIDRRGLKIPYDLTNVLDGLEFIRLAQSDTSVTTAEERTFTFAHRRFQEFFATCMVLHTPELVSAQALITDGRWRETAVVMLQTQPAEACQDLIGAAKSVIGPATHGLPSSTEIIADSAAPEPLPQPFSWPPALLHTLGLLQEGYIRNPSQLPDAVKSDASRILATAYSKGALWDRRWVLEAAGVVEPAVLLWLLRKAFESNSQWVRDAAYRQAARLAEVPHDIVRAICLKTAAIAASRPSYRERVATYTHLARLDPKLGLTEAAKLLFSISAVDVALTFALIALFLSRLPRTTYLVMFCLAAAAMPPLTTVAFALGLRRQYQTVGARSKPIFLVPMHLMIDRAIRFEPAMFFALNLRALLFAGVLGLHGVITPKGILGWYFLYVMFWAPLAIAAGSRAFMTQRLAWPFIPLSPGIYCFRYPQRVLGSLRVLWKSRNDLIYLGGAMAAFLAVEGILLKLGERFLKKLMPWIMGLGATTMIIFWLTQLVSNWGRLRRYLSLNAEPPIVSDFFNNIQSFTLAYFRSRYVRHSRVRGLIISSELNVRTLEAFALALEAQVQLVGDRERIRKAIEQISARVGAEQFRRWYESEPKRSWLKGADPQTLDEINLLIQSLRDNSPLTPAAETRRVLSSP